MLSRICLVALLGWMTVPASAQVEPPEAPGLPSVDFAPPPPSPTASDTVAGSGPLMPIRANQSLTTNALLGFVNSQPVFVQDLFRPIDENLRRLAKSSRNLGEFKRDAYTLIYNQLRDYVTQNLVVTAAQATLTDQDKMRLDLMVTLERNKLITAHGGSVPAADKALLVLGTNVEKEIADLRRRRIVDMYLYKNLSPRIVITRQMVIDAYEKDPRKWQEEDKVELFTITLPVSRFLKEPSTDGKIGPPIKDPTPEQVKNAEAQAMAAANDIVIKLKNGADFARLAEDNSRDLSATRGGRHPDVKRDDFVNTRLRDYIFSLPANTLGQPLLLHEKDPMDSTVIVVKIGEKKEARTVPFSEAQQNIERSLRQTQFNELRDEHLNKLYKGAAVEGVDRMLDVALDAAVTRYATR